MSEKRPTPPIPIFDVKKWTGRMIIAAAFAVAMLVLADPRRRPYLLIPGGALIFLGCYIRLWGTGHLVKNKFLATGGPYSFVRHPLYVGTFLIVVGFGLMAANDYVLYGLLPASLLVYFIYYAPRKERVESNRLEKKFGDEFRSYKAAVKSYFPRITPYAGRQGRFRFAGVIENREYLITVSAAFGVAVIVAKYLFLGSDG